MCIQFNYWVQFIKLCTIQILFHYEISCKTKQKKQFKCKNLNCLANEFHSIFQCKCKMLKAHWRKVNTNESHLFFYTCVHSFFLLLIAFCIDFEFSTKNWISQYANIYPLHIVHVVHSYSMYATIDCYWEMDKQ